jgi:hypothetical protein
MTRWLPTEVHGRTPARWTSAKFQSRDEGPEPAGELGRHPIFTLVGSKMGHVAIDAFSVRARPKSVEGGWGH